MTPITTFRAALAAVAVLLLAGNAANAAVVSDADLVFAHDFEQVSGNTITAFRGPEASKTSNVSTNISDTLHFSSQHLKAPDSSGTDPLVDTKTYQENNTSALSFSMFLRDVDGDGPKDGSGGRVRMLSTFIGGGSGGKIQPGDVIFDLAPYPDDLRFFYTDADWNYQTVTADLSGKTLGTDWHQFGVVFDNGDVQLFFDGDPLLQSPASLGVTEILETPDRNWALMEDIGRQNNMDEFIVNGLYDEAALFERALSDDEMSSLYNDGLAAAFIPEPASALLLALALGGIALWRPANRRK